MRKALRGGYWTVWWTAWRGLWQGVDGEGVDEVIIGVGGSSEVEDAADAIRADSGDDTVLVWLEVGRVGARMGRQDDDGFLSFDVEDLDVAFLAG